MTRTGIKAVNPFARFTSLPQEATEVLAAIDHWVVTIGVLEHEININKYTQWAHHAPGYDVFRVQRGFMQLVEAGYLFNDGNGYHATELLAHRYQEW